MATIDLTRTIFEPRKRYTGVRMQQGRVVLDDDHNEAGDLAQHDAQRTNRDVIGPSGSPDDGFKVTNASLSGSQVDFTIKAGTLYAGGIPVRLDYDQAFSRQPDWLGMAPTDRTRSSDHDLVYLEVWLQPVAAVEDRELAEPALGGPDTTTRLRTMARVRRRSVGASTCAGAWAEVTTQLSAAGLGTWNAATCELENDLRLAVGYLSGGVPEDLCSPSVTAGYLGAENQAIRVQLVDKVGAVGTGELTWGYDNAAPLYRARRISNTVIELLTTPRDEAHWPLLQQTVEVLPWSAVLIPDGDPSVENGEVLADGGGRASSNPGGKLVSVGGGHLSRLASSYDPTTRRVTLSTALPANFNNVSSAHAAVGVNADHHGNGRGDLVFVRLWSRGSDVSSAARVPWTAGSPLPLGNTGLTVTITGSQHGADAHWIIGARPNTPDQVLPWRLEGGGAPNGVRRYLVPLAVVTWSGSTGTVHDCRETFRPLTRQRTCCRYTVGDGETSHGDYTTIQEAVDNLPTDGGEICVLPGTYDEEVALDGLSDITIHGCGASSLVTRASPALAVITLSNCQRITLRGLGVQSDEGWGVRVTDCANVELDDLNIDVRDRGGVFASGVVSLRVHGSRVAGASLATDPSQTSDIGRYPLVFVQGDDIRVWENRVTANGPASPARRVAGGVQIGGNSEDVTLERNVIQGGNGHGVTLGSVRTDTQDGQGWLFPLDYWYWDGNCLRRGTVLIGVDGAPITTIESEGPLTEVRIRRNRIIGMGGDGVGVVLFFDDYDGDGVPDDFITTRDIRLVRNRITGCCLAERDAPTDLVAAWSGHGGISLADVEEGLIRDNEVRNNGTGVPDPTCGVFILNGEGLVIDRNRVSGNGRTGADMTSWLGGIVLPIVAPYYGGTGEVWDGRAAARVVDNQVVVPEGPAFLANVVRGGLLVERNELTTSTRLPETSTQGAVVRIINAGMFSEDFNDVTELESTTADRGGQVVFSNNVVVWQPDRFSSFGTWSVAVVSFDDVVCRDNVGRADLSGGLFIAGWLVAAVTTDVADNRLRETPGTALLSLLTAGSLLNHTTDNVTTHCVLAQQGGVNGRGVENHSLVDLIAPEYCGRLAQSTASANTTTASSERVPLGLFESSLSGHGQLNSYRSGRS